MEILAIILVLAAITVPILKSEYIPPGPRFTCPKETEKHLIYPCVCEKGTDDGLFIRCSNAGLAVMSVGLGNLAGLGLPIEQLVLQESKISNLFGPLLHRSTVRVLHIIDTPIKTIDQYAFAGVNRTLQQLYIKNTNIEEFPKEAFQILGNLSILSLDGHKIKSLGKDIFANSMVVGKLEKLHLTNGLISDISPDALQHLKKLRTLDLHGNRLVTLKRSQFKGLREAEVLDLSYNNLTKLDGSNIGDLTKLGWCNASHNQLPDIPRGMFARNTVIKVVHLDNNKIKKLDTNSFRGMRFLRRVYLQDNQISDVGRGTFSAVTRIGTVDLARNLITKVDFQMFQQVKYAEIINLAENKIKLIEKQAFTDLYLATVNISHNELTSIEPGAFQNCNNMTLLDLSYNNLTEIDKSAFDENTYAFEFQVSYNQFTDFGQIPIHNMTGIRIMNASHNAIEVIPRNAFPKLYELHTVDVSHNNLKEISNAVFQNLFSLRYLYLSHNSMVQIKPATFGTIPTVLELDLSHNQLVDVSRGSLAKLASCRLLDISHNYLEKIFQIPISLGELNMAHNNLTEIRINTWPTMNALLRLNLSHNMLGDQLTHDAFSGLLTLQSLDLSANGLTRTPWEALNTLTSLQYLYLQYNELTSLTKSAFGNLPTTFKLDLSYNKLADIEPRSFDGMQQLLDLSLQGNLLEKIPNEAFKGLVALRKLDLSHNNLEKIDNKTHGLLDDCLSIEMINLSHNRIGFLSKKMFPASPWIPYRLLEIDLSHNEIPVLTLDLTIGAKKVKKLNLSGNYINDIRSNVLGNFTSLEVLDVSNNQLKDLVSRTADSKFQLPQNITHLYLQNNSLAVLPIDNIAKAQNLRVLDVRHNVLTSFYPELMKFIEHGLEVYFEDNKLKCDCFTRPLKHYLNKLPKSSLAKETKYNNIICAEPPSLENVSFMSIDEERLLCAGNIELMDKMKEYGNEYMFNTEPDLAFRDIQYSQSSIYVHWFILSTDDVADFYLFIRDQNNTLYYNKDVAYNLRFLTIAIDDNFKTALQKGGKLDVCIQAKSSSGFARKWFDGQCQSVPSNFESWPKKLNVDKRRLSRKKVKYSWFSNNVLGLVSDSILITLCIFLGVCFRRLSDLDL
ncbi:chaoptin isoform X1 [Pieris brassicae]|uniref:chaoptin isoform X1 n=2 Tax=Pieris brassicae TaxID=7116 RepID=UPI001E6627F8|nr:chaoptin isoform X1 [Pieris brassicae]